MDGWGVTGFVEVRELGRGGQGRVVLALHDPSRTPVAIKYVYGAPESLRREARMLGRVQNPYVARLYRLVESEHGTAIVMEAVDGVPLKAILARYGSLEPEAALLVLKGSLTGLAAAHAVGVVHRDYKPANVVVRADGLSKLIDFGVAVPAGEGSRAGTPHYMAPEQWRGEPAVPATDVYAATCVFFECVTGRRPYPADNRAAVMNGHLNGTVPVEQVPEALRPLVARGLAKDLADRPAEAAAFAAELEDAATAAYGPEWEDRGLRALAVAASGLASLFPLAAAGLAPGGSGPEPATAAKGGGTKAAVAKGVAVAATVTAVAATAVVYASQDRDSTTPDATVQAQPAARTTPGRSPAGVGLAGGYRMARGTISPPGNLSNPVHKVAYYYATSENAITLAPKPGCTGPQCDLVVRGWTIVLPKERIKRDVPLRRLPDGSYRSADGAPARLELKAPQATGFTLVMHVGNVTVTWQATRA